MKKFLIVGLGNIGLEYSNTRHNIGFMMLDYYCKKKHILLSKQQFNGIFNEIRTFDSIIYFAKPTTYMNLSGEFVSKFIHFYNIPIENILVIYDDMDLKLGDYKVKDKGSSNGQNGIKNIINLLHTDQIKRIKIGIGKPDNKSNENIIKYVLSKFNTYELNVLENVFLKILNVIDNFDKVDFNILMSKYNK